MEHGSIASGRLLFDVSVLLDRRLCLLERSVERIGVEHSIVLVPLLLANEGKTSPTKIGAGVKSAGRIGESEKSCKEYAWEYRELSCSTGDGDLSSAGGVLLAVLEFEEQWFSSLVTESNSRISNEESGYSTRLLSPSPSPQAKLEESKVDTGLEGVVVSRSILVARGP